MTRPVLTKADFVRRFVKGEFGNKGPNWNTLDEYLKSDYKGLIHIRSRNIGGRGRYNIPAGDVTRWYEKLVQDPREHYLAGMAPHEHGTIQGELVILPECGWYLTYNTQQVPMRDGFAIERLEAKGIIAYLLLKHYFCANSWEWLQHLLKTYPDHVIEFSAFSCNWGTIPNENVVWWEVRKGY